MADIDEMKYRDTENLGTGELCVLRLSSAK